MMTLVPERKKMPGVEEEVKSYVNKEVNQARRKIIEHLEENPAGVIVHVLYEDLEKKGLDREFIQPAFLLLLQAVAIDITPDRRVLLTLKKDPVADTTP